jgi:hypothetical protein
LSEITKGDKIKPVITITICYSPDKWDAPRSLKEMMCDAPKEIMDMVQDYHINHIANAAGSNGGVNVCKAWEDYGDDCREEGRVEGRAEGREEGRAEGRTEGRTALAINMLKAGKYAVDEIANLTELQVTQVELLQQALIEA